MENKMSQVKLNDQKWEIYKGIINHHINNLITFMNTNMNNDNNVDNRKNVLNKRPKANLQKKQLQENLMSFIHLQTLSPLDSSWKNSYLNQSITTTLKFKRKDKIWEILIYHGQLSLEWIDRIYWTSTVCGTLAEV